MHLDVSRIMGHGSPDHYRLCASPDLGDGARVPSAQHDAARRHVRLRCIAIR